jgi:hypothetical protein
MLTGAVQPTSGVAVRKALLAAVLVLLVAGAAPAAAASTGGIRHAPNHKITRSTSSNWAGYAAINSTFTSVSSSWKQPTASCSGSQTSYSSFWVGLDGYSSNSVEQTGTDADCSAGTPTYYAWYEMYPKFPVNLSPTTYPVAPGDTITASVTFSGRNSFVLAISDTTRHWTFSTTQKSNRAPRSSAEVIAEAPSSSSGVLPLTNFGTANFTNSTANGQVLSSFNPDKIDMVSGTTTKATTSAISGGSFSVAWKHA